VKIIVRTTAEIQIDIALRRTFFWLARALFIACKVTTKGARAPLE
jgi:hypothetical protein